MLPIPTVTCKNVIKCFFFSNCDHLFSLSFIKFEKCIIMFPKWSNAMKEINWVLKSKTYQNIFNCLSL